MTYIRQWRISPKMQNTVVETEAYLAVARKLMSIVEMEAVVTMISADPKSGEVMQGTRGLRKLRIPLQGRGKRGGGRVIYWFYNDGFPAILLWCFAKNAAADLTAVQRKLLMSVTETFLDDYRSKP